MCAVARGAGLGVLPLKRGRIEPGTVGIEPPAALGRVTGETVSLGMASNTALEILACGLPMAQEERSLGIMVPSVEGSSRGQTGAHMAVGAKLPGIMAITATGLPRVGRRRVPGEEAGRMVSRCCIRRIGAVTVETLRANMATATALGTRAGHGTVELGKIRPVRNRTLPSDHGALSPAGPSGRHSQRGRRLSCVAGEAALLSVTGGTRRRGLSCVGTMPPQEAGIRVTGRRLQFRIERQRSGIDLERLNCCDFGSVDVTVAAKIACMAGGAGRRDGSAFCAPGKTAVALQLEIRFLVRPRGRKVGHIRAGQP